MRISIVFLTLLVILTGIFPGRLIAFLEQVAGLVFKEVV